MLDARSAPRRWKCSPLAAPKPSLVSGIQNSTGSANQEVPGGLGGGTVATAAAPGSAGALVSAPARGAIPILRGGAGEEERGEDRGAAAEHGRRGG